MQKLKQGSPASGAAGSAASPTPPPANKPAASASSGRSDQPFQGDPDTRRADKDGVDTKRTGDEVRDNCIMLMYNGLAWRSKASKDSVVSRAIEVEAAAYKHFGDTNDNYKKKMRSLFQNLKVKTNRDLGRNVMDGKIAPDRFVTMTTDELKSAEQRKKENELQKENMMKAQVPMAEKSISDALKCGKCHQKKVSYTQAQTRSADEPMTTFCECTVCGNRWKVSMSLPPSPPLAPLAVLLQRLTVHALVLLSLGRDIHQQNIPLCPLVLLTPPIPPLTLTQKWGWGGSGRLTAASPLLCFTTPPLLLCIYLGS